MGRVRSRKRRVRDDDFIVGSGRISSDYRRIVFLLAEAFREFPLKSWASRFRGRRSVWWGWTVTLLPPRIGNEVAYVTQIIDDLHFAWQAQYLVRLQGAFACSAHWKWGCMCDADHWWLAFCVAGAVFGEVAGCLCLLRAVEMRLHMWRRSLMTCILRGRRSIWWGCRLPLLAPRIGNDVWYVSHITGDIHFPMAGVAFGEVGRWLHLLRALEMTFDMCGRSLVTFILFGRRSSWWSCRLPLVAARIGNDVSYVTQIIDDLHFARQAQYLVRLQGACPCSPHWKWRLVLSSTE